MSETSRGSLSEIQQIWETRAIRKVLRDPNFAFQSRPDNNFRATSGWSLKNLYPNFNATGLDEDALWGMYYLVSGIEKLSEKAKKMYDLGKTEEAEAMFIKIGLVSDPKQSIKSDLNEVFEATGGSLSMCLNFLGLKNVEGAPKWLDFIIRTWGKVPVYKKN